MHFLKFLKIYFSGYQSCYWEKNNNTHQGQGGPKITLRLTLSSIVHFLPRCTIFFIATLVIICWFKMSKINPIFLVIFVLATTEKGTYSKGKDTYVIKWWVEPSKYNFWTKSGQETGKAEWIYLGFWLSGMTSLNITF